MSIKKLLSVVAALFLLTSCHSPLDEDGSWGAWSGVQDYLAPDVPSTIYFDFDSSSLVERARDVLDRQATWLKDDTSRVIVVEGHCDERGTRDYNLALGDRRAKSVENYLRAKGVSRNQMKTVSYGKEKPKAMGDTEDAWAQNRRAVSVLDLAP